MVYTISSTERTNEKATEYETKALLYLMNFMSDSDEIHYFVVDFFNDLTGIDSLADKAWDVQSKGESNIYSKKVGQYLVTLFKNYLSEFNFISFILFVGGISSNALQNPDLEVFGINNFTSKAIESIKEGLKEASTQKEYVNNDDITDENINNFLEKVSFVISTKNKASYIKKFIKLNPSIIPSDEYLNKVFDQIRDRQSIKKNINTENITISTLSGFEPYKKYLTTKEIKLLVLNRLIFKDNISKTDIPISFSVVTRQQDLSNIKEFIEDCNNDIFRMLFDKNNIDAFWKLFEDIYHKVCNNRNLDVNQIYNLIDREKLNNVSFLNFNSAKYFIALIKDGIEHD